MKKLRWQLIVIFLTSLAVGILLLNEQPTIKPEEKPQPVQGGIYTEALIGTIRRLNPVLDYYNPVDRDIDRLVFSGLVRFDERGLPQPDLAESIGIAQDGTIYNFTLRSDAKWHDDEPVTALDVAFTIEMFKQGGSAIPADITAFWQDVEVKVLDDQNMQFKLPGPFAPFLDYLTFGVLPEHLLGDLSYDQLIESPFNLQPVGSGPYRFTKLVKENDQISGVVLSANPTYYAKVPFIDQIIFRYYPDAIGAFQAYQEGSVQGISNVSKDVLPQVLAEPNLSVYTGRLPEISMILLNLQNPEAAFFQDVQVRKALMTGLNRQLMIDTILSGQAILTDNPILPGTWAYYEMPHFEYDVEKTRESLKEAGYVISGDETAVREKEGKPISFTLLYPDDEQHAALAEFIQKNWEALNIKVVLEAVPYDQLVNERLEQRDYQAALVDLNLTRSPDPDPYPFWSQVQIVGGQNYSQWDNRLASEYLEQARVAVSFSDRQRLYHNFQAIFNQELPALPLYYPVYTYAIDKQVQGVRVGLLFDGSDRFFTLVNWFLKASMPSQKTTGIPGSVIPSGTP
jgi:peptide/nickel transport system substrate-binding protein